MSLNNLAPNSVMTINMVKECMYSEEAIRKEHDISSHSEAFVIENGGRSKSKASHGDDNRGKSRGNSKSRKDIKCFYCDKLGHLRKECKKLKKE